MRRALRREHPIWNLQIASVDAADRDPSTTDSVMGARTLDDFELTTTVGVKWVPDDDRRRAGISIGGCWTRSVTREGKTIDLTPKEFDLLVALLRAKGALVSREDLLRRVWGYRSAAMTRTLDTHIAELRRKIESHPASPRHILTVRKMGYRLET